MTKAVLNKRLAKPMKFQNLATQRGVGLIEVLIALVIFALGVVGMAGLQLRTMSVTIDSTQRSYVVSKAQDIADRIRSSGIPTADYLTVNNPASANSDGTYCDTPVATVCADAQGNDVTQCSVPEMRAFDLFDALCVGEGSLQQQVAEWQSNITCQYPLAGVMTDTASCNELGATVTIDISWFARSVANDASATNPERDSMRLRFVP